MKGFENVYEDGARAEAYARLEFPGTYYLAYRDIPGILRRRVRGRKALDFGCGTGRSTRFLGKCGFEAVGIDISGQMIRKARELDPAGDYRLVEGDGFSGLGKGSFDLVFSGFTFDNIPCAKRRAELLRNLGSLLREGGVAVLLDSTPEIYTHEWESFSTKDFPENGEAGSGDVVRIIITAVEDRRPVEDIVWFHEDYLELFGRAGMKLLEAHRPLARPFEKFGWVNETRIAPWVIYTLEKISLKNFPEGQGRAIPYAWR